MKLQPLLPRRENDREEVELYPRVHNGPMTGSLVSWFQSELVSRSYITLLLWYSIPDVPKVVALR